MKFEDRPDIGAQVVYDSIVIRESYGSDSRYRRWRTKHLNKELVGYYIGYRYKQNGELKYHSESNLFGSDYRSYVTFKQDKTMPTTRVALVIPNERSDPILVPFDRMSPLEWVIRIGD